MDPHANTTPVYLVTGFSNSSLPDAQTTNRHAVGVSLAISGNILISLALSVQKYAHNRLGAQGKYWIDPYWWLGMMMMVVGEFGNFMAYGFAPASLVAPLGSVAVMSNVFIAFIFLREPVTAHSIVGVTFVIIGSIFLISFSVAGHSSLSIQKLHRFLKAWTFLVYIGIEAVVLSTLLYLNIFRGMEHLLILLMVVALIASATVISAKAVSTMLSEAFNGGIENILHPSFWIMLLLLPVTTAVQIRFLNRAMQLYNVSDVVPVNFIFFTVSAILAGTIFYQEFYGVPFLRVFMFLFGCLLSFVGVYIISHCKTDATLNCCANEEDDDDVIALAKSEDANNDERATISRGERKSYDGTSDGPLVSNLAYFLRQTETIEEIQPRTTSDD